MKRRKTRSTSTEAERRSHGEAEVEDSNDLLRKFFESRFQPLDLSTNNATSTSVDGQTDAEQNGDDQASVDSGEDFGGFSDSVSEDEHEVMVVEYKDAPKDEVLLDKQTRKALLVTWFSFLQLRLQLHQKTDDSVVIQDRSAERTLDESKRRQAKWRRGR